MTQSAPVGRTGTSAVLGEMSGWIAPVAASADPGGFVPTMAFGGLSDFSAEGIPAGASNVPVWAGGETRSEEPSGNAALAGGSGLGASGGEFGVAGAALAGGSDRAASDGEFGVAGAALAGGSDLAASDGDFCLAGPALAGGSDRVASEGVFGVAGAALAGGSDLAASDGDFCLAGPALAGGSDRVASEGVFGVAAGISDITRSRHSS